MKYFFPLLLCLLLAAPCYAQDDAESGDASHSQPEAEDSADTGEPAADAGGDSVAEQPSETGLRSLAEELKEQLSGEMPSPEEAKALAQKYNIKPPTAEEVRNYASQHRGQVDKALDYAKQFQEFRREQAQENNSGALAPVE